MMITLGRILAALLVLGFALIFFRPGRMLFDVMVLVVLLLLLLEVV